MLKPLSQVPSEECVATELGAGVDGLLGSKRPLKVMVHCSVIRKLVCLTVAEHKFFVLEM